MRLWCLLSPVLPDSSAFLSPGCVARVCPSEARLPPPARALSPGDLPPFVTAGLTSRPPGKAQGQSGGADSTGHVSFPVICKNITREGFQGPRRVPAAAAGPHGAASPSQPCPPCRWVIFLFIKKRKPTAATPCCANQRFKNRFCCRASSRALRI